MGLIAHGAKRLTPAQRNYSKFKGELAGVIIFLRMWRYYLQGQPFILRVDNKALCWIRSLRPSRHDKPLVRNTQYVYVRCGTPGWETP